MWAAGRAGANFVRVGAPVEIPDSVSCPGPPDFFCAGLARIWKFGLFFAASMGHVLLRNQHAAPLLARDPGGTNRIKTP
jgi:hypothetical protein